MIQIASAIFLTAALGAAPSPHSTDSAAPRLQHEPCRAFAWGRALTVRLQIEDESPLFEPKVLFRVPPKKRWESLPLLATDVPNIYEATIPAEALTSDVEYFVQVFDELGNGPARVGSAQEPIRVRAAAHADCPAVAEAQETPAAQVQKPTAEPHQEVVHEVEVSEPNAETARSAVVTQPPAPAPSACDRPVAPVWCSPWLWGGIGVALLAGGTVTWVLLSGEDISSATEADIVLSAPYPRGGP